MSYSFSVEKKNGAVTVTGGEQEYVPEGTWFLSGHEDDSSTSVSVRRCDGDGKTLIQAIASCYPHSAAPAAA
jgi:hypothetical protein